MTCVVHSCLVSMLDKLDAELAIGNAQLTSYQRESGYRIVLGGAGSTRSSSIKEGPTHCRRRSSSRTGGGRFSSSRAVVIRSFWRWEPLACAGGLAAAPVGI